MAIFACRIDVQKGIFDNQCFKFLIKFDAVVLGKMSVGFVGSGKCVNFVHMKSFLRLTLLAACCGMAGVTDAVAGDFVDVERPYTVTNGLQDRNIALWNSHGRYFNNETGRWMWQRCRVMTTVEDLYTSTYVLPYLLPMLERAGAYVMMPRERDRSVTELIIDGDGGLADGKYAERSAKEKWKSSKEPGFAYRNEVLADYENPFTEGRARVIKTVQDSSKISVAAWQAAVPQRGEYAVYVSYQTLPDSRMAHYRVLAADGAHDVHVNQAMGGGTWVYIGTYPFLKSDSERPLVEMSNYSSEKGHLTADAVRIGGGYGNVGRRRASDSEYVTSGLPKFAEGARYYLQAAGAPDSIYTPTGYESDYKDDYGCRGKWVNWLAGGSRSIPEGDGLGIPVDLSFALHSDAGTTEGDDFVGTLGIYSTDSGNRLGNGESRSQCRDLAYAVVNQVVNDVRALHAPTWERRDMRDARYAEARAPRVPALLLELLAHQNLADMSLGLDPQFRYDVSRAIYKGILRFLSDRDGRPYVVQPLAVSKFKISPDRTDARTVTLSWQPTVDRLESSAMPDSYIIEERGIDGLFRRIAVTQNTSYTTRLSDGDIHSYRVTAVNSGGASEPSEVLAVGIVDGKRPDVLIVNGFTRTDAPERFDRGDIAGFSSRDHGVPDIEDFGFVGDMTEFRRCLPWIDDDNPGWGASNADYEVSTIAGNTHDYVAVHGRGVMAAGRSFVSASSEAFTDTLATDLRGMRLVDLILGKQRETRRHPHDSGPRFRIFTPGLQCAIRERALTDGTSILISGSYVGSDIADNRYLSGDEKNQASEFASSVLGYELKRPQASRTGQLVTVTSAVAPQGCEYEFDTQLNPAVYAVESPDAIAPTGRGGGQVFARYADGELPAGVVCDFGGYRTAVLGVPLETLAGGTSLITELTRYLTR